MALDRGIIKSQVAGATAFEYKPREIGGEISDVAQDFVSQDAFISKDFKISELVAQQAGINRLEDEAQRDKIQAQVLEQLKEVQERAYKEGYELGLTEGTEKAFEEAKASLVERMNTMEQTLKRIEELKSRILIDNEAAFMKLIFQIAKKIALRDLEEHHEAAREILQQVVSGFQEDERVQVRLSPDDLNFLENLQEKSGKKIETLSRVKFVADENIKTGGCMIETEYGTVDATIEERVERAWQALQARVPQPPPESKE